MGIDDIIVEGKELKEVFDKKELQSKYNLWCRKVRICMKEEGFTEQEQEKVNVKMHYLARIIHGSITTHKICRSYHYNYA